MSTGNHPSAPTGLRFKRVKHGTEIFLACLGLAMLLVAFYAFELKLDNNVTMGNSRKVLALMGLGCWVLAVGSLCSNRIQTLGKTKVMQGALRWLDRSMEWINQSSIMGWLRNVRQGLSSSKLGRWIGRHPETWTICGALLVILISSLYVTDGLWAWVHGSRYFDQQADAFLHGSLALLEKPSKELLSLTNVYDYHERRGLKYPWDVSLYQGNFYLYWGPIPAVMAAAVKFIHSGVVEDQYLLMFYMVGLAVVLAVLLHWLRSTFFQKAPAWTVPLLTLIGGLNTPVLGLVNRPSVYETAIAGGVFFLILGVYSVLRGMMEGSWRGWLVIAGLAWGASVGCRVNNAVAVIWMVGLTGIYLMIRAKKSWNWVASAICLGLPLLVWAGGLGWYNLARFGSVLETGHRYQLTGPAFPVNYSQVVSAQYIVPNAYNYLIRPLVYDWNKFPFVFAPSLGEERWPWFIRLPEHYYAGEPVTGIFLSIPFFWLVALPILRPLRAGWNWVHERSNKSMGPYHPLMPWVWALITGALACNQVTLLVFTSSTMRYLADVVPLCIVLTSMCIWWGLDFLQERPGLYRLLLVAVVIIGLVSILIGLFVNFYVGNQRFETNNPQLYRAIEQLFIGKQ